MDAAPQRAGRSVSRCNQVAGNTTLIEGTPRIGLYDAVFIPNLWGLYDHGRRLIPESAYFRGPGPELINGSFTLGTDWPEHIETAPETDYYYIGMIHAHYGHFLLDTISRLWAVKRYTGKNFKFVTYGVPDVSTLNFMQPLLEAAGCAVADCITFTQPTRIRGIIIAAPAFEETNYAYTEYARQCRMMGDALLQTAPAASRTDPAYLAKYRLASGAKVLDNEDAVVEALARRGVDILCPEQLPMPERVQLFRDRTCIAALAGSSLHTAAFASNKRLISLEMYPTAGGSQVLIDRLCGHEALYLFPNQGVTFRKGEAFDTVFSLNNPQAVAEDFLRIFDIYAAKDCVAEPLLAPKEGGGVNIAPGKRTRQSSASIQSFSLTPDENSRGAISGFCTGGFQFHTGANDHPWWDIDLGAITPVHEIRLFNRLDECAERSARFIISASDDGDKWAEVFTRTDPTPFGGADGKPFSWTPAELATRYIRITLTDAPFLHLDQVAIYGAAVA